MACLLGILFSGILSDFCNFFRLTEIAGVGDGGGVISSLETIFTCPAAIRSRMNCWRARFIPSKSFWVITWMSMFFAVGSVGDAADMFVVVMVFCILIFVGAVMVLCNCSD